MARHDDVEPPIPGREAPVEEPEEPSRIGPAVDEEASPASALDEDRVALADVEDDEGRIPRRSVGGTEDDRHDRDGEERGDDPPAPRWSRRRPGPVARGLPGLVSTTASSGEPDDGDGRDETCHPIEGLGDGKARQRDARCAVGRLDDEAEDEPGGKPGRGGEDGDAEPAEETAEEGDGPEGHGDGDAGDDDEVGQGCDEGDPAEGRDDDRQGGQLGRQGNPEGLGEPTWEPTTRPLGEPLGGRCRPAEEPGGGGDRELEAGVGREAGIDDEEEGDGRSEGTGRRGTPAGQAGQENDEGHGGRSDDRRRRPDEGDVGDDGADGEPDPATPARPPRDGGDGRPDDGDVPAGDGDDVAQARRREVGGDAPVDSVAPTDEDAGCQASLGLGNRPGQGIGRRRPGIGEDRERAGLAAEALVAAGRGDAAPAAPPNVLAVRTVGRWAKPAVDPNDVARTEARFGREIDEDRQPLGLESNDRPLASVPRALELLDDPDPRPGCRQERRRGRAVGGDPQDGDGDTQEDEADRPHPRSPAGDEETEKAECGPTEDGRHPQQAEADGRGGEGRPAEADGEPADPRHADPPSADGHEIPDLLEGRRPDELPGPELLDGAEACLLAGGDDLGRRDGPDPRQRFELGGRCAVEVEAGRSRVRSRPAVPSRCGARPIRRVVPRWDSDPVAVPEEGGEVELALDPPAVDARAEPSGRGDGIGDATPDREADEARPAHRAADVDDDLGLGLTGRRRRPGRFVRSGHDPNRRLGPTGDREGPSGEEGRSEDAEGEPPIRAAGRPRRSLAGDRPTPDRSPRSVGFGVEAFEDTPGRRRRLAGHGTLRAGLRPRRRADGRTTRTTSDRGGGTTAAGGRLAPTLAGLAYRRLISPGRGLADPLRADARGRGETAAIRAAPRGPSASRPTPGARSGRPARIGPPAVFADPVPEGAVPIHPGSRTRSTSSTPSSIPGTVTGSTYRPRRPPSPGSPSAGWSTSPHRQLVPTQRRPDRRPTSRTRRSWHGSTGHGPPSELSSMPSSSDALPIRWPSPR